MLFLENGKERASAAHIRISLDQIQRLPRDHKVCQRLVVQSVSPKILLSGCHAVLLTLVPLCWVPRGAKMRRVLRDVFEGGFCLGFVLQEVGGDLVCCTINNLLIDIENTGDFQALRFCQLLHRPHNLAEVNIQIVLEIPLMHPQRILSDDRVDPSLQ